MILNIIPAYFLVEKFEFCPKNNKEEKTVQLIILEE